MSIVGDSDPVFDTRNFKHKTKAVWYKLLLAKWFGVKTIVVEPLYSVSIEGKVLQNVVVTSYKWRGVHYIESIEVLSSKY